MVETRMANHVKKALIRGTIVLIIFISRCSLWLQDVSLFQEGLPASDAIKLMAEDGDNSDLIVS